MSARPYADGEIDWIRARSGTNSSIIPHIEPRRFIATVDALQARLAAAEGAMRGVKAIALQHHGWEDRAVLLHALLVEIPTEIDAHLAPAPTKPEGGEVAR